MRYLTSRAHNLVITRAAPLWVIVAFMKNIAVVLVLLLSAGCALTPTQRKVAYVAAAVAVTAVAISATQEDDWRDKPYCGDGRSYCGPIRP